MIGERIRFFRTSRGMTQKYLGRLIGFPEKSADVRVAQYENGSRKPKEDVISALAAALNVSTHALNVPDISSVDGIMHTLFVMEDLYGLSISEINGVFYLNIDPSKNETSSKIYMNLRIWNEKKNQLRVGDISYKDYSCWRYHWDSSK